MFYQFLARKLFNEVSHFMGTNPLVQFVLQPVLIFAVVFHFIMGFILELRNKKANGKSYAKNNGAANSTWMSRNMIWSGVTILAFMRCILLTFGFQKSIQNLFKVIGLELLKDKKGFVIMKN